MNRLLAVLSAISLSIAPAYADAIGGEQPSGYLFQTRQGKPVQYERRAPTLEELIQRSDMPFSQLQPIPLHGVKIQGLVPKSVDQLGFNYFVVIDNAKYEKMSDVYRDTRLSGKSNFVTTDSIIHPYLAFSNRVLADTTVTQMVPDMLALLDALQQFTIADYKSSEDAEVREDIEKNIAYLAVAIKLLNPRYEIPKLGGVPKVAETDLQNLFAGRPARSAIFERDEDFSQCKPTGFFLNSDSLQRYFRCREWLSRMAFPIIDTGGGGSTSNNFRRSVLLFRALEQSSVLGKPSIELWSKLNKASALLGSPIDNLKERTLYPPDYRSVFQGRSGDLKVTLNALAEPLFRTKLMLAIRKQKPNALTSASIFELEDGAEGAANVANFRLFPIIAQPEQPWLRLIARSFPTDKTITASWPVGLLDMYAWGAPVAGNVLSDNLWSLEPSLVKFLPDLVTCVMRRAPGGAQTPVDSRAWKFLSTYFRPLPDTVPPVLRSDLWMQRRLLSAFGGWVDSQCAIAPERAPAAPANEPAPTAAADPDKQANGPTNVTQLERRPTKTYHYLEPSAELYRLLEQDLVKIQADLVALNYMSDRYKTRFSDFQRLFQRLQKISEIELRGQQLTVVDKRLLGNIDQILSQVDVPLPAVLPVEAAPTRPNSKGQPAEADPLGKGMNLAVGRPGLLYVIYQNPQTMEWTLGRGAVYTYYELTAPLLTDAMWQHRVESGFAQPLPWTARWQLVQKELDRKPSATAAR